MKKIIFCLLMLASQYCFAEKPFDSFWGLKFGMTKVQITKFKIMQPSGNGDGSLVAVNTSVFNQAASVELKFNPSDKLYKAIFSFGYPTSEDGQAQLQKWIKKTKLKYDIKDANCGNDCIELHESTTGCVIHITFAYDKDKHVITLTFTDIMEEKNIPMINNNDYFDE